MDRIGLPEAWETTLGNPESIVAVLDTGIDHDNQDLVSKLVGEVNFTSSATSDDLNGHGTHIAGTITQVAPACSLLNVKVADDAGNCRTSEVAEGIVWAADNGAKVINLSLSMIASPNLEEAVNYAWDKGAVVVAAAGNETSSAPTYPAAYTNCIAVAATDESGSLASFSNHGDWVDVAAPGVCIYSTWLDNQYEAKSGTSAAAAVVSGVAALVFSVAEDTNGSGITSDEVRQAIENNSCPIGTTHAGKGRINAYQAVRAVASLHSVSSQVAESTTWTKTEAGNKSTVTLA